MLETLPDDKSLRILIIGCGNSSLGYDMYKEGFTNIDNIDYADTVIERMKEKYKDSTN
jgi:2-polyprenyl-3-methyl-5-hydroxy-6-metoxy-1,4-benzoquinol methylase